MILHKPTNKEYKTRLECKKGLGGETAYNKALKNGELLFINIPKPTDIFI